jgi:hypothetical protein
VGKARPCPVAPLPIIAFPPRPLTPSKTPSTPHSRNTLTHTPPHHTHPCYIWGRGRRGEEKGGKEGGLDQHTSQAVPHRAKARLPLEDPIPHPSLAKLGETRPKEDTQPQRLTQTRGKSLPDIMVWLGTTRKKPRSRYNRAREKAQGPGKGVVSPPATQPPLQVSLGKRQLKPLMGQPHRREIPLEPTRLPQGVKKRGRGKRLGKG